MTDGIFSLYTWSVHTHFMARPSHTQWYSYHYEDTIMIFYNVLTANCIPKP